MEHRLFYCDHYAIPLAAGHKFPMPKYRDFLNGTLAEAAVRRIGFPWSEALVQRTMASVGGTLGATCNAFDSGWGGNLAGGTQHAFRAAGSGFCVINDIAVAIRWLRAKGRIYQSGVDPLASDTLGRLALTHAGLQQRDLRVIAAAQSHRVPIVITLGGGYSRPIELTAEAHANTFRTASEIFT